jgi:hypothetical protein
LGRAVHAPICSVPKAAPRVSANQVEPSPTAAATMKVNNEPSSSRTDQSRPIWIVIASVAKQFPAVRDCFGMLRTPSQRQEATAPA